MSVKICPEGGFSLSLEIGGEPVETQLIWREATTYGEATVRTTDPKHLTKVIALLTNTLGGGLNIEFDQSLLAEDPGCAGLSKFRNGVEADLLRMTLGKLNTRILAIAVELGIDLPDGDSSPVTVERALKQIAEQITQAQASELDTAEKLPPGAGPGETIDVNGPPQASIGGVVVGEAQPGTKRTRRTKAQIEADNAAAEAAKKAAAAPAAPTPVVPAQPTPPNPAATAAFQEDLKAIEAALPPPTTVPLKPVETPVSETRVEPVKDELDEMVDLLSNPPMPVELHPLDFKRSASDRQFLDTASVRLHFGYPLADEYKADPNFNPASPPNSRVNMVTDEGVIALVQWMHAIAERAGQNGKPIGQLDMIFQLGTLEEVIGDAVEKVRKRREAAAAARRAAAAGQ
jgi:hypothetical protein